jgi:hypothetical protein
MWNHLRVDAELGQGRSSVIGVHDDPVEARQEPAPEIDP